MGAGVVAVALIVTACSDQPTSADAFVGTWVLQPAQVEDTCEVGDYIFTFSQDETFGAGVLAGAWDDDGTWSISDGKLIIATQSWTEDGVGMQLSEDISITPYEFEFSNPTTLTLTNGEKKLRHQLQKCDPDPLIVEIEEAFDGVKSAERVESNFAQVQEVGKQAHNKSQNSNNFKTNLIWKNDQSIQGYCFVKSDDVVYMDGPCSGLGHGGSFFVTAQSDGCSLDITKEGNKAWGEMIAYKDICNGLGDAISLKIGPIYEDNGCWFANSPETRICLKPS